MQNDNDRLKHSLTRLQAKARIKSEREAEAAEQAKQAERANRAEVWSRIQTHEPQLAEFLTAVNATFGKPEALAVEMNGELILKQGRFAPRKKGTLNG